MPEKILLGGTDGFRGPATTEAGPGLINEETFALATYALTERQLELGQVGPVVIGQDTRESGEALRKAAIAGALMHDVDVIDLGVAPTPTIQKVSSELGGIVTVAVTASHNPAEDNGWKGLVGSDKPSKEIVADISARYWSHVEDGLVIPVDSLATDQLQNPEFVDWYADQVVDSIVQAFGEAPLNSKLFVVDGAYGAAQALTPTILRRLGATVEEFSCDGLGIINDGCGAADLAGLKSFLQSRPDITSNPNFIGALANDGDADRVMALGVRTTGKGTELVEVVGNHSMSVYALGEPGIVGTEYTNSGLVQMLKKQGIEFEYCQNGDIFVTERLRQKQAAGDNWRRGGEFTGHHIDTDWLSSGDGVRMAAWLAAYAVKNDQTFGTLYDNLPLWEEVMTKVKLSPSIIGAELLETPELSNMLLGAKARLGDNGRLVVRPSGTEPVIRVWGEGKSQLEINETVKNIAAAIESKAV